MICYICDTFLISVLYNSIKHQTLGCPIISQIKFQFAFRTASASSCCQDLCVWCSGMCKTFVGCAAGVRIWTCAAATGEGLEGKPGVRPGLRNLMVVTHPSKDWLELKGRKTSHVLMVTSYPSKQVLIGTERDENPSCMDGYNTRIFSSIGFFNIGRLKILVDIEHVPPVVLRVHGFGLRCRQNQGPPRQIPRRSVPLAKWLCLFIWRNLTSTSQNLNDSGWIHWQLCTCLVFEPS